MFQPKVGFQLKSVLAKTFLVETLLLAKTPIFTYELKTFLVFLTHLFFTFSRFVWIFSTLAMHCYVSHEADCVQV